MKPILLVVAGIAMLMLAIYLIRKAENKQFRPLQDRLNSKGVLMKKSDSFLPNEAAIYHFFF